LEDPYTQRFSLSAAVISHIMAFRIGWLAQSNLAAQMRRKWCI